MVQDVEKRNKSYNQYVENVTKKAGCVYNCFKAFITGGIICSIGQILIDKTKLTPARILVIFVTLGTILTSIGIYGKIVEFGGAGATVPISGFGIYPLITSFGGAGALVPITGFANSIASPAIEYKKEGQVFGIGCQIFKIAGPVILYGIFSSWVLGLIYWLF